jgi:hypothetical protein
LNKEELFRKIHMNDVKYFYQDKIFNGKGMDYQRFIKLRYNSINFYYIRDVYTIEGWYMLWHLMARAELAIYVLHTTINCISEYTGIKNKRIKELLLKFDKIGLIYLSKVNNLTYNTPIELYITYNTDEYEDIPEQIKKYENQKHKSSKGFNSIPVDFAKTLLNHKKINANQWCIYTVLNTNFSYYTYKNDNEWDSDNKYKENHYAFPTMRQIENYTGIPKSTVNDELIRLSQNEYNIIKIFNTNEYHTKYNDDGSKQAYKSNNIYYIPLFEKIEYVYHQIYNVTEAEKENKELMKSLKNAKDFKKVVEEFNNKDINRQDYIKYYFKDLMKEYEKCIKNKDEETYKKLREIEVKKPNELDVN